MLAQSHTRMAEFNRKPQDPARYLARIQMDLQRVQMQRKSLDDLEAALEEELTNALEKHYH